MAGSLPTACISVLLTTGPPVISTVATEALLPAKTDPIVRIGVEVTAALTQERLFEQKAKAMVDTWRYSWFAESGVRILCLLPRDWTDEVLPLTVDPAPRELVRGMVGHSKLNAPTFELPISECVLLFDENAAIRRFQAIRLGHCARPAFNLVMTSSADAEFRRMVMRFQHALWPAVSPALPPTVQQTSSGRPLQNGGC